MLSLLWEFYLKSFLPSPLLFVFNRPMRLYHPGSFSTMGKLGWKEFHWATPWSAGSVRHRLRLLCLSNNVGSGAETTSLSTELHLLRGWDNAGEIKLLFFLISRGVVLVLCSCVVLEVPTWIPDSLPCHCCAAHSAEPSHSATLQTSRAQLSSLDRSWSPLPHNPSGLYVYHVSPYIYLIGYQTHF